MTCKLLVWIQVLALVPGIRTDVFDTVMSMGETQTEGLKIDTIKYSIECAQTDVQDKLNEMLDNKIIYYSVIDLEGTKNSKSRDIKSYGFESCNKFLDESRNHKSSNELMYSGIFSWVAAGIPFQPHNKYTTNIASIRDVSCCTKSSSCVGCYEPSRVCFLKFYAMSGSTLVHQSPYTERICNLCAQIPCDTGTCKNGEFADGPMQKDPDSGIRVKSVICTSCEKGSWNTCQSTENCRWNVPEAGGIANLGSEIYTYQDGPIWSCYPCDSVKSFTRHYVNTSREVTVDKGKTWICPGGNTAPRNCKNVKNIVKSKDWSRCECEEGFYGSEDSGCLPCPTGHYCVAGAKTACADHTYQSNTGATSCNKCSDTGDANGYYNCGIGKQLKQCLSSVPDSQNRMLREGCVPCTSCKRHYITPISGQVDCYRG